MMRFFLSFADFLARMGAYLASAVLVGMVGLILWEIVLRSVFHTSTFVMDEFVGYGVASVTFMALAHAVGQGQIIRVGLLIERVPPGPRRWLESLSAVIGLVTVTVLIYFFWLRVARAWTRGSVSNSVAQVPMWIPEAVVMGGLGLLWLQLLAHLIRNSLGDMRAVTPATR
ncbi:TRAP transporter small permease subunit [Halodurantibacterium flavum]|uniref:TRAP transporter small permease protein n=1 Tax=Halodurantibacterium flavum TaxID=1382802 RepID=A0ABW4S2S8_9RHOB